MARQTDSRLGTAHHRPAPPGSAHHRPPPPSSQALAPPHPQGVPGAQWPGSSGRRGVPVGTRTGGKSGPLGTPATVSAARAPAASKGRPSTPLQRALRRPHAAAFDMHMHMHMHACTLHLAASTHPAGVNCRGGRCCMAVTCSSSCCCSGQPCCRHRCEATRCPCWWCSPSARARVHVQRQREPLMQWGA